MWKPRHLLPVHMWDERLTTVAADKAMMEAGLNGRQRKEYVDMIAAVFILQGYLDYLANQKALEAARAAQEGNEENE